MPGRVKIYKKQIFLIFFTLLITPTVIYLLYLLTEGLPNILNAIHDPLIQFPAATLNFIVSSIILNLFYVFSLTFLYCIYLWRVIVEFKVHRITYTNTPNSRVEQIVITTITVIASIIILILVGLNIWRPFHSKGVPGVMRISNIDILLLVSFFLLPTILYSLFLWLALSSLKRNRRLIADATYQHINNYTEE